MSNNTAALRQHGLAFPNLMSSDGKKRHHQLALEFTFNRDQRHRSLLRDELQNLSWPDNIVISSETFWQGISKADMRDRLAEFFSQQGYAICVIAYVRPQLTSINSQYAQGAKTLRTTQGFGQYVEHCLQNPVFDHELHYRQLLLDRRFTTKLTAFNSKLFSTGICVDFLARLDVDCSASNEFIIPKDYNISPGPKTVAAMLRVAKNIERLSIDLTPELRSSIASLLRKLAHERGWEEEKFSGLTRAHKQMIIERFAAANDRFSRTVWARPWREVFAEDEKTALQRRPCVFRPATASEIEQKEFFDFVRLGVALVREMSANQELASSGHP